MVIMIVIIIFAVLTLVGIGAWIWAATHEGPVGLMAFCTIVAAGCLVVGVTYDVHSAKNQPVQTSKVTKDAKTLKSNSYFNVQARQKAAKKKQTLREQAILKELRETYKDSVGTVTFNAAKMEYVVNVTQKGYRNALVMVGNHPKQNKKALKTIRKSFVEASKVVDKAAKKSGYLLTLKDHSKIVLQVKDGKIISDHLVK